MLDRLFLFSRLSRRGSHLASRRRRRPRPRSRRLFQLEALESRLLLSIVNPIVPSAGELNLLEIIDALPLNDIASALDHFPVPYVVVASADGAAPTIANNRAGAPTRIDADRSKATGMGGNDIQVEVNTELLPTPHLVLDINRLGETPFAQDLSVVIAFPFSAFTNEVLPGSPNLFIGYQTRTAGGDTGLPGGHAPLTERITFTPHVLAGTNHTFELAFDTTGAANPLTFIAGHFDGTNLTGILNADAISAYVEDVPAHIGLGLTVDENALFGPASASFIDLSWTASAPSLVTFDYLENESFPFSAPDFNTTITLDRMPTSEHLIVDFDEAAGTLTLTHDANAVIDRATVLKQREDGLTIIGTATDIPTHVELTLDLSGSVDLEVNTNTLDLELQALQEGGFLDTADFLGYDLGYASVKLLDVPDLHAGYDPDTDSFGVTATNPGESIGAVELVIDDDAHFGAIIGGGVDADADGDVDGDDDSTVAGFALIDGGIDVDGDGDVDGDDDGTVAGLAVLNGQVDVNGDGIVTSADVLEAFLVGLALPPSYFEGLPGQPGDLHHLFSVVDDGSHGTAVARLVRVATAILDLDADASQVFHLELGAPSAPMQVHLKFGEESRLIEPDPNADIEITCDIDNVPFGVFDIHFDGLGSFGYTTDPPQTIDSIHCFGHMGTLNFDIDVGGLPPVFDFDYDPDSHVTIFAEDGFGGPAAVGHVAARFFDEEGPVGLPDSDGLFGTPLRDARMRVDDIPSSHAQWTQVQILPYDGGAGALPSVGDVVFDVATGATSVVLAVGGDPATGTLDIGFIQSGTFGDNDALDVLDTLAVDGQTEDFAVGAVVTGETSGASATVRRAVQIGGAGVLYLSNVAGAFLDDENLLVDDKTVAQADGALQPAATWAAQVDGTLTVDGTLMDFNTDAADVFLGGVQFQVSTIVELEDPLPVADPSASHFALLDEEDTPDGLVQRLGAGAFGIDEFHLDTFSSLNLHYDGNEAHLLVVDIHRDFGGAFFPPEADFQYDLQLAVNQVPQAFDFTSDLMTQFVYEASAPITSITLAGTVDDTDDGMANGTEITFGLLSLPSQVRFGIITDEVTIANGRLDVNASGGVDGDDDGMLAGATIVNGQVDLTGDGAVDASDDGTFFGIAVIDGELDVDASGGVDAADDGALAGAELTMNAGIAELAFSLESVDDTVGIYGSVYRLLNALVTDVPAQFLLSYGDGRFLLETRDAAGSPEALGEVTALVSTTKDEAANDNKARPFTLDGPVQSGPILGDPAIVGGGPGGSRINYSEFLQEIDERYYNGGVPDPSGVLIRLAELYADSEQLDVDEDHLLVRKEDTDSSGADDKVGFASFHFTTFQRLSWTPDADGGQFIYRAPGRGDLPFFAGYEEDDTFSTLQIEHVPDEIVVDYDETEHLTYTASASPGEIDFYQGPAGPDGLFAGDADTATRALMRNTPTEVRIFWSLTFPNGGVFMDASNEFEVLFLTQDGGMRITAGLTLEDLHLGYGIELFSFDETDHFTIPNPIPFCDNLVIPIAWALVEAKAGIDNDADGLDLADLTTDFDPDEIAANLAKADVAGFFALYDRLTGGPEADDSPQDLVDPAVAAPGDSYVPLITVMAEGFREFSMDFLVELDPTNFGADFYPIDLEFEIDTSNIGNLVLDLWSSDDTDETFDLPLLPEVGFINPPDYTDNTPFHILPGLFEDPVGNGLAGLHNVRDLVFTFDGWHTFDEHFDPFAGTPAPFTGSSGTGGFSSGDAAFLIAALGPFAGALNRWEAAGEAAGMDPADITALINDVATNTDIEVASFAGPILGAASGTSASATIQIDTDAGGFEWFVDTTPFDEAEFGGGPPPGDLTATAGGAADGKVDMLTFFAHEVGHILGLDHATEGVMQAALPRGVRRLPVGADLTADPPGDPAPDADDTAALTVEVTETSALEPAGPAAPTAAADTDADAVLQPGFTFSLLRPAILDSAPTAESNAGSLEEDDLTPPLLVQFDETEESILAEPLVSV